MCVYSSHSGHSSTVWAISFNAAGDKMVTCRLVNLLPSSAILFDCSDNIEFRLNVVLAVTI